MATELSQNGNALSLTNDEKSEDWLTSKEAIKLYGEYVVDNLRELRRVCSELEETTLWNKETQRFEVPKRPHNLDDEIIAPWQIERYYKDSEKGSADRQILLKHLLEKYSNELEKALSEHKYNGAVIIILQHLSEGQDVCFRVVMGNLQENIEEFLRKKYQFTQQINGYENLSEIQKNGFFPPGLMGRTILNDSEARLKNLKVHIEEFAQKKAEFDQWIKSLEELGRLQHFQAQDYLDSASKVCTVAELESLRTQQVERTLNINSEVFLKITALTQLVDNMVQQGVMTREAAGDEEWYLAYTRSIWDKGTLWSLYLLSRIENSIKKVSQKKFELVDLVNRLKVKGAIDEEQSNDFLASIRSYNYEFGLSHLEEQINSRFSSSADMVEARAEMQEENSTLSRLTDLLCEQVRDLRLNEILPEVELREWDHIIQTISDSHLKPKEKIQELLALQNAIVEKERHASAEIPAEIPPAVSSFSKFTLWAPLKTPSISVPALDESKQASPLPSDESKQDSPFPSLDPDLPSDREKNVSFSEPSRAAKMPEKLAGFQKYDIRQVRDLVSKLSKAAEIPVEMPENEVQRIDALVSNLMVSENWRNLLKGNVLQRQIKSISASTHALPYIDQLIKAASNKQQEQAESEGLIELCELLDVLKAKISAAAEEVRVQPQAEVLRMR
ncbi:MAG: hypothetical protein K0Q74_1612 [Gammaproteobacteria bacterium]|nr:hypothetical protein [Gammaproteobacteria bacterium]